MSVQQWIFTVVYGGFDAQTDRSARRAVVGPARSSTVEAALHLANVPESIRSEIRSCEVVRTFVEGRLDPAKSGYYTDGGYTGRDEDNGSHSWTVCIGSVHEVLQ